MRYVSTICIYVYFKKPCTTDRTPRDTDFIPQFYIDIHHSDDTA